MTRGGCMKRKPIKPGQLRRVGGVAMLSMAVGIFFAWVFGGLAIAVAVVLLVCGFYSLFM